MNIVAVIQARMGSTRLPGKVLQDVGGRSMLERVVRQVGAIKRLSSFVVATSVAEGDELLVDYCNARGWPVFRGDEFDVLDRFCGAARATNADHIVRVTADCPLLCFSEADRLIERHLESGADYSHNVTAWGSGLPLGTGSEAFTRGALERSDREGHLPHHREHVDEYIYAHPEIFKIELLVARPDLYWPELRLTVDEPADLALMSEIFRRLEEQSGGVDLGEVLKLLRQEPDLTSLNAHVVQKVT